ncbi:MAG: SHOCT domain-containing protein [Gemmataceae bacterium]
MSFCWALLAADDTPDAPTSLSDPALLWTTFALIAALLIGALIIAWFDRWRKRPAEYGMSPAEQLAAFKLSYERGELSQQEYERIKAKLGPKVRRQMNLPDRPKTTDTAPEPPPPPAEPPAGA